MIRRRFDGLVDGIAIVAVLLAVWEALYAYAGDVAITRR